MQLIVYKHSGVTEIFFNIAYVRYWFLYKSFNTKNFFKKKSEHGHCVEEAKVYEFQFFLYNFAQGHLCFHVLMLKLKAKSSTQEPKRKGFWGFSKEYLYEYDSRTYRVIVPHLCASRLFALVPKKYYPYVRQCAIFQVTSLAHDEWDQLLGTTASVHLVPVREQTETWNHKEGDDNHSSYTPGYWQAQNINNVLSFVCCV